MAIDPTIALQIHTYPLQTPLSQMGDVEKIRDAQQQRFAAEQKLPGELTQQDLQNRAAKKQLDAQQALDDAYTQAFGGGGAAAPTPAPSPAAPPDASPLGVLNRITGGAVAPAPAPSGAPAAPPAPAGQLGTLNQITGGAPLAPQGSATSTFRALPEGESAPAAQPPAPAPAMPLPSGASPQAAAVPSHFNAIAAGTAPKPVVIGSDGTPQFDRNAMAQILAQKGAGHLIPGMLEAMDKAQEQHGKVIEQKSKLLTEEANYLGAGGAMAHAAGDDPDVLKSWLIQAVTTYGGNGPAGRMLQALAQNPGIAPQLIKQMLTAPDQAKLANEALTAQGAKERGDAAAGELTVNQQKQKDAETDRAHLSAINTLSSAPPPDKAAYSQFLAQQQPEVAKRITQAVPVEQYDPAKSPGILNQSAMTPEQRFNANKPVKPPPVTEAELSFLVAKGKQPNATPEDIAAGQQADLALKRLDQSKIAARPVTNVNMPMTPAQVDTTAGMIGGGKIDPASARTMLRRQPGLLAEVVKQYPDFDEVDLDKRYNTAKEFSSSSTGKAGGQVLALNTLVHHADLYLDTAEKMQNGTFGPGNAVYNAVASAFGSDAPKNAALVARFLAGETGKVATGGVPAEGEINGILQSLGTNASPQQIKGAGQKLLEIASGRMIPLQEKLKDAHLENQFPVLGADAKQILTRRGFDPNTMRPVAGGGSGGQAAQGGYIIGRKYGNLTYNGGDPNNQANWK